MLEAKNKIGNSYSSFKNVSFIWAQDKKNLIGNSQTLSMPWPNIPEDLTYFKKITWGHSIVMGRKTYLNLPSKPLKGRKNFVLTSEELNDNQIEIVPNLNELKKIIERSPSEKFFIIGGKQLFQATLPWVKWLYQTIISGFFPGDIYMVKINYSEFRLINQKTIFSKANYQVNFNVFERLKD